MTQRMDPRNRITEGVTRARLKMEGKRAVRPGIVLIMGVAVMLLITAYFVSSISETLGRKTYQVRFAVDQDFGVFEGFDDVRFRGVTAGTISKVEREGSRLILVATIQEDKGTVYRDAKAQIRPITPLNDVYLDIVDPGTPEAGEPKPSEPLDESQTLTSVTVPDVLNIFDADARLGTSRLLDELGNGMEDGGARLRQAFIALGPFLREARDLTAAIADREDMTKRLIHNTAVLTTELGRRETELMRLVSTGAAAAGTLGDGSDDLEATLAELGPTFTELRSSLASVRAVVDDVDTAVTRLYPVAERLPGGLESVRSLNQTLGPAIDSLRQPVKRLVPFGAELDRVANRLRPIATSLLPQIPTVDRLSERLVDCERGVIGFFQWNASLTKFGDQNSPVPRGNLAFGVPALGLPGEALREPEVACTPGPPARGVIKKKDLH